MSFKMTGAKELDAALKALATSTAVRVTRRAMTTALQPVLAAAQSKAPRSAKGGKHIADTIAVSHKLTKSQAKASRLGADEVVVYVGAKDPRAHLIEFGTGPRHKKNGAYVGVMPANPFMRPAWDENRDAVLASLTDQLRAEIEKTAARSAKRRARAAAKGAK